MNMGFDRKLALPPADLAPIDFTAWRPYQAGALLLFTVSSDRALPHLMLKDKAVPRAGGKTGSTGLAGKWILWAI